MSELLSVHKLATCFHSRRGIIRAVDEVSFSIAAGETLALVGESGSGKSVTAASILRLISAPGRIEGGEILFQGQDLLKLGTAAIRQIRGNRIAMIFQEPLSAFNPVQSIGTQIVEAIRLHRKVSRKQAFEQAVTLLERMGIPSPAQRVHEFPHRLSGGMRQRAMIAMALSCEPDLLIADEPTTALDVTTQAQILELLKELQAANGMGMLLITHDLGMVAETAHRAAVMYAGRVVEEGSIDRLFTAARHPYTAGLLASVNIEALAPGTKLPEIPGSAPSLLNPVQGCAFAERCNARHALCDKQTPPLATDTEPESFPGSRHRVACFLPARPDAIPLPVESEAA
ncbi:dipeptide/oligopeptide/nickel ABC transporter ATP-binding protein [Betaproteobacteria bacterium]|nr:dipeptide/oligopeptide/nickel ABC transporter ATP-binding protein [Betaproteobacteria bacterium]GHU11460.1 dipeptide/oligopeptide/nickel ABC transporter ATP-binding protein [Betaproteobacteria bacterium]GHU17854.1 dipeptide/oligopeptide/nickel ABC transporter ATP-binding protein [Betaproteobacteria bacterium]